MPISINSNIASLQANRRLFESGRELETVFERLSSGQRINRASDDAAGLAIASGLNADSRVFSQGIRNFNDGISLLNIADSTLGELSSVVIRIQELAEQAANGSLSRQQRESLDQEAQALRDEFFRISRSSEFNGTNIFDGSLQGLRLQGGYGMDGSIFSELGGDLATGDFATIVGSVVGGDPSAYQVAVGDLNNDGHDDIFYSDILGVGVLIGDGEGGFEQGQEIPTDSIGGAVGLGDFNNDGFLDAIGDHGDGTFILYTNNGDGTFGEGQAFSYGGFLGGDLAIDDVDGDGNLDVVASDDGSISVSLGNGSGSFAQAAIYQTYGNSVSNIRIGDVNGDGVLNLVTASDSAGPGAVLTVLQGNGDGTFQDRISFDIGIDGAVSDFALEDINQDGTLDVVAAVGDEISILTNDGSGTFQNTLTFQETAEAYNITDLELEDVNGDGITDLIWGGNTGISGRAAIRLGVGDGTFGEADIYQTGNSVSTGLDFGDFNGDGVLDIAVGALNDPTLLLGNSQDGLNPLLEFSLSTQADALQALAPLEQKLNQLSTQRGVIGAFQSRLNSALSVLGTTTENSIAAESRIRDADIAFESSNLVRLSILQQAGAAVLSQANTQPSLALDLLR